MAANQPSGTVTFLFTDIEDSTHLCEQGRALSMEQAIEFALQD